MSEDRNRAIHELFGDLFHQKLEWNKSDETIYCQRMERFTSKRYNPNNAAALEEINFNVNDAAEEDNRGLPPPIGFEVAIPIIGIEPITKTEEIFAYIFFSCKLDMVILSFSGTETLGEWLSDLVFIQERPTELNGFRPGMLVERGFYNIYLAVQTTIREQTKRLVNCGTQLVVTGHSLGGALATLGSFDLAVFCPFVYLMASPRVGNPAFTQAYNQALKPVWRIINTSDIVPDLPLPAITLPVIGSLIYEHVGNPVPFTLNLGTITDNHVQAYREIIIERNHPVNPNGICPRRFGCSGKKCRGRLKDDR